MFDLASDLPLFRLMPVEAALSPRLEARWSWKVVDMERRLVAFHDDTVGKASGWHWDFGDGTSSTEQHPIHAFTRSGNSLRSSMRPARTGPGGGKRCGTFS